MSSSSRASTSPEDVYLSVIIPAYDEVKRIGATVDRVLAFLSSRPFASELIVVLDGGRPGAAQAVDGVVAARSGQPRVTVLDNGVNRGKGFSVRRGVAASTGRHVIFADADLSLPIEDAGRFLDALEAGADLAIGSRALPESSERGAVQPIRQSMSRLFNWAVQRLAVPGLRDTQCGFKAFRGACARTLFQLQRIDGFAFDVEILRLARSRRYRVVEVAVACESHPSSSVRKFRHALTMLRDIVRIRWYDARRAYDV